MFYFSKLLKNKVFTEDGIYVGKLDDLIILISSLQPKISKLVVKQDKNNIIIIPAEFLLKINHQFIIRKNYSLTDLQANEIFVLRNLLDKQIIDLSGNKIVRVNDVCFREKNDQYYLSGVDVGFLGIMRRLGLEDLMMKILNIFKIKIKSNFLSWTDIQPLELTRGFVSIKHKEEKLEKLLPEDLADYLEKTNIENVRRIINLLDEKKAGEIINQLNLNYQSALFKKFKTEEAVKFIKYLDPDEAVDILLTLTQKKREEIINSLPSEKKGDLLHLLKFSETSIGELMTTEYLKVKPEDTVKEVIELIKKETVDFSFLTTIYVINERDELIGVFNLHELLLQSLETFVYQFMKQNLIVLHLTTPKKVAVLKMLKYNLQALPVINEKKRLLGVVTIDDLSDYILENLKL